MTWQTPEYELWLHSRDVQRAMGEITGGTPRHAAVIAGALIEDQLKRLIALSTADVLTIGLKSSGYRQCLDWAYRFALIDRQLFVEMGLLGDIRNMFAHRWTDQVDFDTEGVAKLVKRLQSPKNLFRPSLDSLPGVDAHRIAIRSSNQAWWYTAIGGVMAVLRDAGDKAKRPTPPKAMDWLDP